MRDAIARIIIMAHRRTTTTCRPHVNPSVTTHAYHVRDARPSSTPYAYSGTSISLAHIYAGPIVMGDCVIACVHPRWPYIYSRPYNEVYPYSARLSRDACVASLAIAIRCAREVFDRYPSTRDGSRHTCVRNYAIRRTDVGAVVCVFAMFVSFGIVARILIRDVLMHALV